MGKQGRTKVQKTMYSDEAAKRFCGPVDPELLLFAIPLYQAAAMGTMPGSHIPRPDPESGPRIALTNIPMNRGMLAVMNQTRHLSQEERMALGWRLMHFGEAIQAASKDPRFTNHVRPAAEAGATEVSDGFQRAYARCKFAGGSDHIRIDMDDLLKCAEDERAKANHHE